MVWAKTKPYRSLEVNKYNNLTDKNKGKASNPKRCIGKKKWTKTQGPELEAETNFKGWCSDLEGYILDLGPRALDKFARTMTNLDRYLWVTYSDICQPYIVTKTP